MNRIAKTTRVQRAVLNLIAARNIRPGERIPTEMELAREMGASAVTVQRALADLVARTRGRGSFVKATELLVARLHARGCRRMALVNGARTYAQAHEIYRGFGALRGDCGALGGLGRWRAACVRRRDSGGLGDGVNRPLIVEMSPYRVGGIS